MKLFLAELNVTFDVFDDNDRVINDSTNRNRDSTDGEDVERESTCPHSDERQEDGAGDRDSCDERRSNGEKENKDDDNREAKSEQSFCGEGFDRLLDKRCLIKHDIENSVVPHQRFEFRDHRADFAGDVNSVGVGGLGDRNRQRWQSIDARNARDVVVDNDNISDFTDRRNGDIAVARINGCSRGKRDCADVVRRLEFGPGHNRQFAVLRINSSRPESKSVGGDCSRDIGDRQALIVENVLAGENFDVLTVCAEDRNFADPVKLAEFFDGNVVENLVELRLSEVACDGVLNDWRVSERACKNLRFN
ncbi:unannotated protein [freshwater metagenome]|uniref:Unannotated protein n=1 Tax=freshwater metagenome TaxID=449393 RepID=A0A6J6G6T4_9ZZZZ